MANTYVGEGKRVKYTNPSSTTVSAGDVVAIGIEVGVAIADIAYNTEGALSVAGVHDLDAKTTDTWDLGAQLYWDETEEELTDTAGANNKAGIAAEAKTGSMTKAQVILNARSA